MESSNLAKQRNEDVYFLLESFSFHDKFKFSEVQWAENYRGRRWGVPRFCEGSDGFVTFCFLFTDTRVGLWKLRWIFLNFNLIKFKNLTFFEFFSLFSFIFSFRTFLFSTKKNLYHFDVSPTMVCVFEGYSNWVNLHFTTFKIFFTLYSFSSGGSFSSFNLIQSRWS